MITSHVGPLTYEKVDVDKALKAALNKSRSEVIGTVSSSGLKGRGGAGFPTGVKWNLCAAAQNEHKFLVCNADEGEPGTFKDRILLTDYAKLVFAGMVIGGYAIGATKGLIYLRGEYQYLRAQLEEILEALREDKLLGFNILGKDDFSFDIEIRMGAGAYVCGEETALIESLEGHRGEPRNRPPYPVDTGFLGQPTAVNNVETLAWVTTIFDKGAEWFKGQGTEKSPGLKIFSVSGDCKQPGVYELPFGVSVADLLKTVGGEDAKAVQIGGASGHCIPAKDFGRKIGFEDIATGGSVIVFGPQRDLLEVAINFMEFFSDESCGQCTPCRDGCPVILKGLEAFKRGECSIAHLHELRRLGETMQLASKCGLGQSAANAFLSITEHFADEVLGRNQSNGFKE
ncbi:iron hydrogenase [bacterium]|nr:iron hydrogenase [bacterium]